MPKSIILNTEWTDVSQSEEKKPKCIRNQINSGPKELIWGPKSENSVFFPTSFST